MLKSITVALGGLILAQGVYSATIGDATQGQISAKQCKTCHGLDGYAKIPIAPHIGGEPAGYITRQLQAFRDGTRRHEMMSVIAKNLNDQTIADIAAWYSSQDAVATLAAGTDEKAAPEQCVQCHGVNGISTIPDAPNLAGESVMYIDTQLKAFRKDKRTHEVMSVIAKQLSDEDIRFAAEWYANTKLEINR